MSHRKHKNNYRFPENTIYFFRELFLLSEGAEEKPALVGCNGAGKTTLVKLLRGLYAPTEGVSLMNDVDIRKYRYEEYMRPFSVVFQDFQVFSFPMGEYFAGSSAGNENRALDAARRQVFQASMASGFKEWTASLKNTAVSWTGRRKRVCLQLRYCCP